MSSLEGKHIALIPDGNRRWAEEQSKELWEGHKKGADTLDEFIDWAIIKNKARAVSVYSLSTQNLAKRSVEEVKDLVKLYKKRFRDFAEDERVKGSIRINFPGNLSGLPKKLKETLEYAHEKTKDNEDHVINFLLPYGGKYELTRAMKNIAQEVKEKSLDVKDITQEKIQNNLLVKDNPDLVIRTAEKRMSNFLIWQTAYSEIFFIDKYWPALTEGDFEKIEREFAKRKRTYGK